MSASRREEALATARASGRRIALVLPIHAPRALLRAFGFHPVELWGPPGQGASRAASSLQPMLCSVVRCGLDFLLEHRERVALGVPLPYDIVLVPHACDSLQGLGSLLLDLEPPGVPVLTFYLPRQAGEIGREFLEGELGALASRLAGITGETPSESAFERAQEAEEAADGLATACIEERPEIQASDRAFWGTLRRREWLPLEEWVREVEVLRATRWGGPRPTSIPVLLSGILAEPMALYDAIEAGGGLVVADDTAVLGRRLRAPGQGSGAFARMASHLLSGPPDPTLGAPLQARIEHLTSLAARSGARAVIFTLVRACEPELFDLPALLRALEARGLRALVLETDLEAPRGRRGAQELPSQVLTRVEALLESLS